MLEDRDVNQEGLEFKLNLDVEKTKRNGNRIDNYGDDGDVESALMVKT